MAAATRVPVARRGIRPHAGEVALQALAATRVEASVQIVGGGSPAFAVAFTLRRRGASWIVSAISTPG